MDSIFQTKFHIDATHSDCFGRLKPSSICYFVQEVAGQHCLELGLDWDTLASRRMFWAIIRHRVQITRLPQKGETITLETWPMPTTRVAFPRSVVAYDSQGNELFRSISIWVLMDMDSRAMILPGKSGVDVPGLLRGSELAPPKSLMPISLSAETERKVHFNDLDLNGHMNNCRYLDWVCDLLPSGFHHGHTMKEFTLCYLSEAREGETLKLQWELRHGGVLRVETVRHSQSDVQDHRIFSADILF